MSTTATLLTVEEYLALPEDESQRRELIGGDLITMARAGKVHEIVKSNFNRRLWAYYERNPIARVMSETTYQLSLHDAPQPDVSVILEDRLAGLAPGMIATYPDVAIEVVSSESAAFLQTKVKLYLHHGARAVWVAYPDLRMIQIYDSTGVRELAGEQHLEAPEVLPGFSVPVSAFFDGI